MESTIVCDHVPKLRSVRKFVEKRVGQWLSIKAIAVSGNPGDMNSVHFLTKFERLGRGPEILCAIQIQVGDKVWRGTAVARGVHRAFMNCLDHISYRNQQPPLLLTLSSQAMGKALVATA